MALPFQRSAGLEPSHVLPKAPGDARSPAGYSEHQVRPQSDDFT